MKIKVCGLKDIATIEAVEQLGGVDFSGFIFHPKSPRYVGNLSSVPKKSKTVQRVGVFVDSPLEEILQLAEKFKLSYIQLHGNEDNSVCEALKAKGYQVIKVILVNNQADLAKTTNYPPHSVDYFLFDTKTENHGGSGKKFNWNFLQAYKGDTPFFLSGGISPSDAATIKAIAHPKLIGVDINSRFEFNPGEKNTRLINEFISDMKTKPSYLSTDSLGFYGEFGGAYIPELLKPNVDELQEAFNYYRNDAEFLAEFRELLKDYVGRPTPLYLSKKLSEKYGGNIYLKREDLNHTGAHKINNTIGQILLAKKMGKTHIIAETGAGQHGVATATACALMDLKCTVFMGEKDIQRQAPNVLRMKYLGAEVIPATSGSKTLKDATNEAIRYWINHPETFYLIGSVVGPHPYPEMVAEFQSIISEEIKQQLATKTGKSIPDTVIACVGGGSNAAGAFYHFYDDENVELIAVEASGMGVDSGKSAATSFLGKPGVIHGSMTLLMQDNYGQITEPYSISAGLDYPGIGPLHAHTISTGRVKAIAVTDQEALKAAKTLSLKEGIIPALETAHALAALDQIDCNGKTIVINLSGRGDKDMETLGKTHH